jgi:hypothetical protein
MLPSESELKMGSKAGLDLFTITNLAFMDIAHYLKVKLNLFACAQNELGSSESVEQFSVLDTFYMGEQSHPEVHSEEVH